MASLGPRGFLWVLLDAVLGSLSWNSVEHGADGPVGFLLCLSSSLLGGVAGLGDDGVPLLLALVSAF